MIDVYTILASLYTEVEDVAHMPMRLPIFVVTKHGRNPVETAKNNDAYYPTLETVQSPYGSPETVASKSVRISTASCL